MILRAHATRTCRLLLCCCGRHVAAGAVQISGHFERLNGRRLPIRGESAEYSLEVVRYDRDSKGACCVRGCGHVCMALRRLVMLMHGC
jgi:hypothetical protein